MLDSASATQVAQALQQNLQQGSSQARPGTGNKEADGGWCISWCKDRYWGEVLAVGCGTNGIIKVRISQSIQQTALIVLQDYPGNTIPATNDNSLSRSNTCYRNFRHTPDATNVFTTRGLWRGATKQHRTFDYLRSNNRFTLNNKRNNGTRLVLYYIRFLGSILRPFLPSHRYRRPRWTRTHLARSPRT